MNDPRFESASRLYDVINDIEKNIGSRFGSGASGFTSDLNTHVRDTIKAQVAILRGVADTINVLSNTVHEAEKGFLTLHSNLQTISSEGVTAPIHPRKELTTVDYRQQHPERVSSKDYRPENNG